MTHFSPHGGGNHCFDCEHWGGWDKGAGCYTVCLHNDTVRIKQNPSSGCAQWTRAIGADDAVETQRTGDVNRYRAK